MGEIYLKEECYKNTYDCTKEQVFHYCPNDKMISLPLISQNIASLDPFSSQTAHKWGARQDGKVEADEDQ